MKIIRDGIPASQRSKKSREIADIIKSAEWYAKTDCFFVYAAIRSEVDLDYFCECAWTDNKLLFFPKVARKNMDFFEVTDFNRLEKGAFGVREPSTKFCRMATEEEAKNAVLLAPGLAFSPDGYRIGYGGGYYDRYLERMDEIYPVGICFSEQLTEEIVPKAHDRRMREIITEKSVLILNRWEETDA
jgi:5-formyltetrahydrofolate cyclo-ligase